MKNVGILTHCVADNYGANLQALSTAAYLKNHGYNPIFIKWEPYPINNNSEQLKLHTTFLERHGFIVTGSCVTDNDFVNCIVNNNLDFIIVGSDCVFTYSSPFFPFILSRRGLVRKEPLKDWVFPNPFWLPFYNSLPPIKAAIMSGSCGASDLHRAKLAVRKEMNNCLSNFSYISVRDSYTKKSLGVIIGEERAKQLPITPDPVFAFNLNVANQPTKEEILKKYGLPDKYIVMGFYEHHKPSNEWLGCLKNELNRNGIKLVNLPMPQGGCSHVHDININLPLDSIDWYCLIKYSQGYIGNNMHPIISALHNGVPFYSINAHGKYYFRGLIQVVSHTKEYELLERFNLLENHTSLRNINRVAPKSVVKLLLEFDREHCLQCASLLENEYRHMMKNICDLI